MVGELDDRAAEVGARHGVVARVVRGNYAVAGAAFRRAVIEFPNHPKVAAARLSVAWTALRQDRNDDARRAFLEFVRVHSQDPQAPDALLLASELALRGPAD